MRRPLAGSFRVQMVSSVFGGFLLLVLSTAYILFSTIKLQGIADDGFQQERYLKSIKESLSDFQVPLLEYLSTRSSNALATILIDSQNLRSRIPASAPIVRNPTELREREVYSLIRSYLDLADAVVNEKRGRNVGGYIRRYDEMSGLLKYIDAEIEAISAERFRGQIDHYGVFMENARGVQQWNLLFIAAVSLFAICLLLRSVEKMTGPMVRLSAMAAEISGGNFGVDDIEMSSVTEIDRVVDAFNRMKKEISSHIDEIRLQETIKQEYMQERLRNMRMEGLVRRMEVYTLQAQMNPHFLFNTLNTGMQLAIVEGADRTGEYMDRLSALLRHNIGNKDAIVPLRHEIEGLEAYFYILKVRFPKNLDLVLDYPEELLDRCRVPACILQPLAENCVVHAFKAMEGIWSIVVRAEERSGRLVLSVADNGCGIAAELAAGLLQPINIEESSAPVMGLGSVIQRLYFFYPGDPGIIAIKGGADGKGASVVITIDMEREPCTAS